MNVVSFRNNFNKIMETPYSNNEWKIGIKRKHNTLFLDVMEARSDQENEEQKLATYWG